MRFQLSSYLDIFLLIFEYLRNGLDAVKQGRIKEEQINQAVKRILAWKYAYQII